jgi:enterochelin esterase family protein
MMKRSFVCAAGIVLALALIPVAGAQGAAGRGAAAAGRGARAGRNPFQRGPRIVSPQVNQDNTITMRFYAPQAHTVVVQGELDGKPHPMTKAANGVWSVTVGPLAPDVYNYQFLVDGIATLDPLDPAIKQGFGAFTSGSLVEVPEANGPAFDDAQNVPHGSVHIDTYYSSAIKAERVLYIYTPPGYATSTQSYPVFYLLHGASGTASSWIFTGRENYIMDNLIAEGRAKPMIIVNPLVYPWQGVGIATQRLQDEQGGSPGGGGRRGGRATTGRGAAGRAGAAPAGARPGGMSPANDLFMQDLLNDAIPYVEKNYRTLNDPDHQALGGLSMGGGATIRVGFTHTNLFHTLVMMSPATPGNAAQAYPAFFQDPAATNSTLKLVWLGMGSDDTLVGPGVKVLNTTLTDQKIDHEWWTFPGGRHEWVVWRHALEVVAPQMFK